MSNCDISNIQDDGQVEITDLDSEVDGSNASVSILLLRFVRTLPFINNTHGKFTLLVYLMCAVILLFMIQPDLPVIPNQAPATSSHELQYPLAIYPFTFKDTSPTYTVTRIRTSKGQVIIVQIGPGETAWHECKVQRRFTSLKYAHSILVICT